jgi:hypothetical protein
MERRPEVLDPAGHIGGDGMEVGADGTVGGFAHAGQVHGQRLPSRRVEGGHQPVEVGAGPTE